MKWFDQIIVLWIYFWFYYFEDWFGIDDWKGGGWYLVE